MARTERIFTGEFPRSVKMLCKKTGIKDSWYHKWVDAQIWMPFDATLIFNGVGYAIEYKICKAKKTMNMAKLFSDREHQIVQLNKWAKAGGENFKGVVLINWFIPRKQNRCFALSADTAQKYIDKGTVPMEEFIADPEVREKVRERCEITKTYYWDL